MKKQNEQVTESAPETSIERYYREKNERRVRAAHWKGVWETLEIAALSIGAMLIACALGFAIVGGVSYFWQTQQKADAPRMYVMTTNGWVFMNGGAH